MTQSFQNVAAYLPDLAKRWPQWRAVLCPALLRFWRSSKESEYTFAQLNQISDYFAHRLTNSGLRRGMRTVLMVPPSIEFFALTFALFKMAAVPVLVDPGMGIRNLGKCLGEAEPAAFIGIPKANMARWVLGWARPSIRLTISIGRPGLGSHVVLDRVECTRSASFQASTPYPVAEVTADEMAAILYTSGSTGVAKGAVYTHGNFAAQVEAIRNTFGIPPGEVDLCTFPLFALFAPALGMSSIVPDMNPTRPALVDANKIIEPVQRFGVTNLFGSPALLNRVAEADERHFQKTGTHFELKALKRVVSAGAPVSARIIERFTKMLAPGTQVFTPYGATEALPVAVIGSDEILHETREQTSWGAGICVGRPVAGIDVRIIRISDEPITAWSNDLQLAQGQIGEITVRGAWVTRSYFNRSEATALAKIADGDTVWHRMGDVGYFDDRGRLWFCGRKSQRVVIAWGTLFTDQVEPVFDNLRYHYIGRTALVGVVRGGKTLPVLCYEAGNVQKTAKEVEQVLRARAAEFEHTRRIETYLRYDRPTFPVDIRHNSKIFREKLAAWAARRLR
jgi:acyl-CoA synthetase (AMP-forming)/AMP-acid ligase II